jgi:hypothetical protein
MQFRLLGPLEVAEQNMAAALGGIKQRSLLIAQRRAGVVAEPLLARPGREGVFAPDDPGTRFRWSLTGAGS